MSLTTRARGHRGASRRVGTCELLLLGCRHTRAPAGGRRRRAGRAAQPV